MIACLAWPPLFLILPLVFIGRIVGRARRGSNLSAFASAGLLVALTFGLMYLLPSYAFIVLAAGVAAGAWLVGGRLGAARSRASLGHE